jgi:hypothetical protein
MSTQKNIKKQNALQNGKETNEVASVQTSIELQVSGGVSQQQQQIVQEKGSCRDCCDNCLPGPREEESQENQNAAVQKLDERDKHWREIPNAKCSTLCYYKKKKTVFFI